MTNKKSFVIVTILLASCCTNRSEVVSCDSMGEIRSEQRTDLYEKCDEDHDLCQGAQTQVAIDRENLQRLITDLEGGIARLEQRVGYTADVIIEERVSGRWADELTEQEVRSGEVGPEEIVKLKARHNPFSVYMKWSTVHTRREL